jgi:hypothetical protein
MCVWDGTYMAPEAEREAMEQVPGWVDDEVQLGDRCDQRAREPRRLIRWTTEHRNAA